MEMPRLRRGFGITLLLVYALYCVLNAIYGSQGSSDMSSADNDTSVVQASVEAENATSEHEVGPIERWIDGRIGIAAAVIFVSILILGKSADSLVDGAVTVSIRTGMPRVIVGATIVSIGTTFPEAVVSVLAAFQGAPDLALGNAVGSIICDTGLILGLACTISPLPLNREVVNRQGWVQFGAGLLLVALCVPFSNIQDVGESGGVLPQWAGFLFLLLLVVYIVWSIKLAKTASVEEEIEEDSTKSTGVLVLLMAIAAAFVGVSSMGLIDGTIVVAKEFNVPQGVIAATIVAFGTSLPELVTSLAAVKRGQGELAVGNVIGADILNVLFVAGAAAAVTPAGLNADKIFFAFQFPAMLLILILFRIGIATAKSVPSMED